MCDKLYEKLREATPKELLDATVRFYIQHTDRPYEVRRFLHLGFALAQPGGWQRVAPAWLDPVLCQPPMEELKDEG